MYNNENDTIVPKQPYLVQRIVLGSDAKSKRGPNANPNAPLKTSKIDYRKVKCVHGGVPSTYDKKAVNDPEAAMAARKGIYNYDYMGSSEFEWGAVPLAYWKFLRAFDLGNGIIKRIEINNPSTGEIEKFWIFAPKNTVNVATAFLRIVCHLAAQQGYARIGLKEGLRLDAALFPKNNPDDSMGRHSFAIKDRAENTFDQIGWFDLDNCYYIFWDRGDIAQAFSNLHNFGNVLNLDVETYNLHEGFVGVTDYRAYFKAVIEG
jgi:hypothetical protein